jgi:hypothetical protein
MLPGRTCVRVAAVFSAGVVGTVALLLLADALSGIALVVDDTLVVVVAVAAGAVLAGL